MDHSSGSTVLSFFNEFTWRFRGHTQLQKDLRPVSNEAYFLDDFWKISHGPPFAPFQKMRVLGDLAKIAITWQFGYFCGRCLRLNFVQSLHFKSILIKE